MASASKTVTMDVSIDKIYSVLKDYESYPDFMDGVEKVEVIARDAGKVKARYSLNLIKKFSYTLDLVEDEPNSLKWTFDEGDLFSVNNGAWELEDNGDETTTVTYSLEADIKIKMMGAGMITKKLTEVQLPSMLKAVEKRAKSL